jgi:diguanylate cyclase (GGDEF)-like protein
VRLKHLGDFATRLRDFRRALRGRHRANDHIVEIVRAAARTPEPERIASHVLVLAAGWLKAPRWAVVIADSAGRLRVLARRGMDRAAGAVAVSVANWVVRQGRPFWASDVSRDARVGSKRRASVVGFPLAVRGRTMGALVGMDTVAVAEVTAADLTAIDTVVAAAAVVVDSALTVRKFEELAITDDLTGLHNSRSLRQMLGREVKRSVRTGRPLSLLFVDLDLFKGINDRYGHLVGSRALVEAGRILAGCARETDTTARYGGDEFALVLPETGSRGAVALAERVRERIAAHSFLADEGINFRLTASVGVATLPDVAATSEELLKAADHAMYLVKERGKDGIEVATE